MWIYWVIFALPAVFSLHYLNRDDRPSRDAVLVYVAFLTIIIGLRFHVGVDFGNYVGHYLQTENATIYDAVSENDAAFGLLNWFSSRFGLGVWFVNMTCAVVFSAGIFALARRTPQPWIALAISIPQIAIVVGMGYTRQSVALGGVCLALIALTEGRRLRFFVWIIAAALFHRSAIIMLFLGVLDVDTAKASLRKHLGKMWWFLWFVASCGIGYIALLSDSRESLTENYIETGMISDGTYPRVMMNVVAAAAYLTFVRPRQESGSMERLFWSVYAWTAIPFLIVIIFLPPLTAIDRVALYWMPLQIYTYGHLPAALTRMGMKGFVGVSILLAHGITQFVWFTYANYSWAWKPYRFYPIEVLVYGNSL